MGGSNITVSGGNTSVPYVSMNNTNPIQGMLRIWGTDMQVYDGNNWMTLSTSYATVELNAHTQSLLQWVEAQRTIAFNRMEAVQKNPALSKAYEAIVKAEANFDILAMLSKDYDNNGAEEMAST